MGLKQKNNMTRAQPQKQNKNNNTRELLKCGIRALEGEGNERKFELSFSSEEPYMRWFGPEILDHSDGCVDLSRLQEIGVVLFNHDRDKVIGKVLDVSITDKRGIATIQLDDDEDSETIYKKVSSGTLKGVSVGYIVDTWEEVNPGKTSLDGRFTGPCSIAKRWTPYEISIVSVPADATVGVGREMQEETVKSNLSLFEKQIQINKNRLYGGISK